MFTVHCRYAYKLRHAYSGEGESKIVFERSILIKMVTHQINVPSPVKVDWQGIWYLYLYAELHRHLLTIICLTTIKEQHDKLDAASDVANVPLCVDPSLQSYFLVPFLITKIGVSVVFHRPKQRSCSQPFAVFWVPQGNALSVLWVIRCIISQL